MRIAVCEDNEIHRDIMEHLLNRYSSERSVPFEFVSYEYGRNFLYDMEEGAYFDAVFLDIYMDDIMMRSKDIIQYSSKRNNLEN